MNFLPRLEVIFADVLRRSTKEGQEQKAKKKRSRQCIISCKKYVRRIKTSEIKTDYFSAAATVLNKIAENFMLSPICIKRQISARIFVR